MRIIKGLVGFAVAVALVALPAGAFAKRGDRDHDRMADKWEKRHHLNVHANDSRQDPDKDGLSNISEFRHHTDPRSADTDDDGIDDHSEVEDRTDPRRDDGGDELSGSVVSFDSGVLTIQPAAAGASPVSGVVNDSTLVKCDDEDDAPAATASRDGSDDGGDDRSGRGDGTSTTTSGGHDDGANHDAGDDNEHACTSADLKPGARVHEAKLATNADGSMVFTKIELVPAA